MSVGNPTALISTLIDKQDNFEIIRDKIADILKTETASQQALASAAGKTDPDLWKLRVFLERSNAWEQWITIADDTDLSPLVTVEFDSTRTDERSSNTTKSQVKEGVYNLDCFAVGISENDAASGHTPGDREATLNAHRALRLVRNIIMADIHTYLKLRPMVGKRMEQSSMAFRPEFNNEAVQHIVGARLTLMVRFIEETNAQSYDILEIVNITTKRAETGEVLFISEFDYS